MTIEAEKQVPSAIALALPAGTQRQTAHEMVRSTLRRAVLSGQLPAGTHLVQADIAAQLGVSVTPVREALRDLASDGLLQLDPHRGAVVRPIQTSEVLEIFWLRQILEPMAIRQAVEYATEDDIEKAARLHEEMKRSTDPRVWVELNRQFHGVLCEPARSPRLLSMLHNLRDSATMYIGLSLGVELGRHLRQAPDQHAGILEAYRTRDGDLAAKLTAEHLEITIAELRQLIERDRSTTPSDV